ncbi:MAG: methyltransferase domain-containing protein [bacterium]|nr:methyltransferase domain-containing protein [bacterium]
MKQRLLNFIVCPYCSGKLKCETFVSEGKEIFEGVLKCNCGRCYPIVRGVPRMLPDSLRMDSVRSTYPKFYSKYQEQLGAQTGEGKESQKIVKEKRRTLKAFGYEWKKKKFSVRYREYLDQFLDLIHPIKPDFFKGKLVLEGGCGTGRHTYYSADFGAEIIGVDLSDAVDVAYDKTKGLPKAHVIQADIYKLPFKKQMFDYVFSVAVLHHLPDPEKGFRSLLPFLKKGGTISAWVYGKEGNYLLKIMDPIRKHFISKLPYKAIELISFTIITLLYPIIKLIYGPMNRSRVTRKIAWILPQNYFFYYLSKMNFKVNYLTLYDQLMAPTSFYYTKKEFASWFVNAKLKKINVSWRNRNSWRGFAIK